MEPVWFKSYMPKVPHQIHMKEGDNLVSMFLASVERYPDHVVLNNLNSNMTYTECDLMSQQFANYLKYELQLSEGARVAIMLPNIMQSPVAMLGILRAGMVVVNVNPLYTARELTHQLNDAEVDALLVLENFASVVQRALPKIKLKKIIITALGDAFPTFKRNMVNFVVRKVKKMVPKFNLPNCISYREVLALGEQHQYQAVEIPSDNLAYLQYTGGTTGVAKGAELTHRNMVSNVLQCAAWVKPMMDPGEDSIIVALPLYHIFSLTVCFFAFLFYGSRCILVTNPRDISGFVKLLSKIRFNTFVGLNTLFSSLMNDKRFGQIDWSHLKLSVSGGMALQSKIAERWHERTGLPIVEGYGLTEASPVVSINPINLKRFNHSIGLPIPSTDVKIIDDNGQEVGIDTPGELCVRGPQVMRGYWKRPEATAEVIDADGWLKTGDIARIDAHGFMFLVDRKKDMIVVSGFNVYPNEIEDVIASMKGIRQVAVIGVPSERTTEAVKAFIVRSDPNITEHDIIMFCREHLTRYKIPKQIEFRFDLPVSNVGKVLRRKLKEEHGN
jgi:long-chain acyl-CoA synthetase